MVTKERDEELALFFKMRRRELDSEELHTPSPSESMPPRKTRTDEFLDSENDKSDYDWLLAPPAMPLFPSVEKDSQKTVLSQIEIPNALPTSPKSKLDKVQEEPASRSIIAPNPSSQTSLSKSNRRSSSSVGFTSATSGPATKTVQLTVPSKTKPSRSSTPSSRPTLHSKTKPFGSSTPQVVRASTPTRSAARSSTPTRSAARSSTPTRSAARSSTPTRSAARSSTPTARPSLPTSKSTSRSATPNRGPSAPSVEPSLPAPPGRSSSAPRSGPIILKKPVPSRGSSPAVKSRPWKPSEMPGFSFDAPPNLRTSISERPPSASRCRPGAPSSKLSSINSLSNGKSRQQPCSPSRGRPSHGSAYSSRKVIQANSRSRGQDSETESPVLIGTKMVDRVVNMRKLVPPKQDDSYSTNNVGCKSLSTNSSGFGRTLSNKSLDMALRHMDIRRSVPGKQRPSVTNIPASSVYSVSSGSTKRPMSGADSPLATSSNASSESNVKYGSFCLDGCEIENNDNGSENGNSSAGFCKW